ncbi:MAG: reverse transcriptase family protein [Labilithrix sp.]
MTDRNDNDNGRPRTRQELYDRIRRTSKDTFILEDMIRLGFWPARGVIPDDPAEEMHEIARLERELAALRTEQSRLQNVEALRRELMKRRLEESKAKQLETKKRRERERVARADAWKAKKREEIGYLGAGFSAGLTKGAPPDPTKLKSHGLPVLTTAKDVATAMGITVPELRFLAFGRKTSGIHHYVRFAVTKKTGGERIISAPMPRLKKAQRWILDHVLAKPAITDVAHGFAPDRSIVTNARPHVKTAIVVNLDLKDFFPTVTFRRIKGLFEGLGYGEEVSTIFALLTSEPDVDEVELDGLTSFVARGPRRLPQGSPASPAITNLVCRRMDKRLEGMAAKLGYRFTRYADDLSFSAGAADNANVGKLLRRTRWIVAQEGFRPHEKKTRIFRRGRRQEVTGVVVNDKPGVPRDVLKRFRALLFQLDKDGPEGKRWGNRQGKAVLPSAIGFASYVAMVDPERGKPLLAKAKEIALRHGWKPTPPRPPPAPPAVPSPAPVAALAPEPEKPPEPTPPEAPKKKKWWQVF